MVVFLLVSAADKGSLWECRGGVKWSSCMWLYIRGCRHVAIYKRV